MTLPHERLDRDALAAHQGARLQELLRQVHGCNDFYTRKFEAAGISLSALNTLSFPADLGRLPQTTKREFIEDQAAYPPFGSALTYPLDRYTRFCQTSSTTGTPLRWIDTHESWQWMLECWKAVYRAARVEPGDRVFFPFSFGPFLGFWAGFEAGAQMGLHVIPGVLDLTHVRTGPVCVRQLGDWGANIWRVERVGDPADFSARHDSDFQHKHRNKRGMALDLKSKSGIHRLITALEERGFVRRLPHRARAIEIVRLPEETNWSGVRLVSGPTKRTRSNATSNSSAIICIRPVELPVPNSQQPVNNVARPSSPMASQEST